MNVLNSNMAVHSITLMCLNVGTPKAINFSFGTNGKLMIIGIPIPKQFRVHLSW